MHKKPQQVVSVPAHELIVAPKGNAKKPHPSSDARLFIYPQPYFVYEDGEWKHAFAQEEYDLFMPGILYEEFVEAQ